ncbi:phosphoribosyl-AMP cyclohydrolase [Brunnivagina elsteri]|uniref:phosphoribosyl-AMP cyclohydrolase n=1 Tax=Brunnivagina elsteri CCALA 953 TaxID=987040 RepID=A0A2A2TFD2_9CYAN|nr:phosphoribosyl-AMP cyclohydrolase [Calothrix elsteri]PAX52401.1 hypothetical protein CK510_19530 [Calothrix elsteri CCALA 953]
MNQLFNPRISVEQVEEGSQLAPKFDSDGLIPVVTTDVNTGEVLMHAYMNEEALVKTIETGEAHYYSRGIANYVALASHSASIANCVDRWSLFSFYSPHTGIINKKAAGINQLPSSQNCD